MYTCLSRFVEAQVEICQKWKSDDVVSFCCCWWCWWCGHGRWQEEGDHDETDGDDDVVDDDGAVMMLCWWWYEKIVMYVGINFFQVLSGIGCPFRAGVLVVCQFCFGGGRKWHVFGRWDEAGDDSGLVTQTLMAGLFGGVKFILFRGFEANYILVPKWVVCIFECVHNLNPFPCDSGGRRRATNKKPVRSGFHITMV